MSRRAGIVASIGCLAVVTACAPAAGAVPIAERSAAPATPAPAAAPAPRWTAAGALFDGTPDALGNHFCSGSVIDTPGQDTVLTAAHCVATGDGTPARTGMEFVPGYADGRAPFGVWTVTAAAVAPAWLAHGDPSVDVAVLTVHRADGVPVERLTGGFRLTVDPGSVNAVEAIGYPDDSDAPLVRAGTTTRFSPTQLELDAPGLYDGTSGGPWVCDGDEVVGVTGGYEQGGLTPDVSYASYLDAGTTALLPHPG
jgi:V8-like Glu-specific endopeptidase